MQMHSDNFEQQRKTLVVGLGKTGLSCARYLSAHGTELAVIDSRDNPPGKDAMQQELPDVALYLGGFRDDVFAAAEQLLVSPGVSLHEPHVARALAQGIPVLGDIEVFASQVQAPVIAITGSNGKSTVTSLVADMARAGGKQVAVGGNLGTPALDLLTAQHDAQLFVLELSSFQLETTYHLNAVAAVVLNVSEDHMDRYHDLQEYADAKRRIYRGDGVMVVNADDPLVSTMSEAGRRVIRFTLGEPDAGDFGMRQVNGSDWLCHGEQSLLSASELRIPGKHNLANALAALALGSAVDLPRDAMLSALRQFTGLPHRCQWVAERGGVNWYNDSKATNVGATLALVEGLPGSLVMIMGGQAKGQDFSPLMPVFRDKVRDVVLMGEDAALLAGALDPVTRVQYADSMQQAVQLAASTARCGDSVVLSPACASFDMFDNFEQRGELFMQQVRSLTS